MTKTVYLDIFIQMPGIISSISPIKMCYLGFYLSNPLCAFFQALAVATLGDRQMAQRVDNLVDDNELKRFYLQVSVDMFMEFTMHQ